MILRIWICLSLILFMACSPMHKSQSPAISKESPPVSQKDKGASLEIKNDQGANLEQPSSPEIAHQPAQPCKKDAAKALPPQQPELTVSPANPTLSAKKPHSSEVNFSPRAISSHPHNIKKNSGTPIKENRPSAPSAPGDAPNQKSIESVPPCLYYRNKPLDKSGISILPQHAQVKLHLPQKDYVSFYQRLPNGEIQELSEYCKNSEAKELEIDLRKISEDTDWLLVTGEVTPETASKVISQWRSANAPQSVIAMRGLKMTPRETKVHTQLSRQWRIYTTNPDKLKEPDLLAQIEIFILPFRIDMKVQRSDSPQWQPFDCKAKSVHENDKLQLKLQAYKTTYLTIFLCDSAGNRYKLFPRGNDTAQKVSSSEGEIFLPSAEDGFVFDATEGTEYICCFYDNQPFSHFPLQRWLAMADLRKYLPKPGLRGAKSVSLPPPTSVYVLGFKHDK